MRANRGVGNELKRHCRACFHNLAPTRPLDAGDSQLKDCELAGDNLAFRHDRGQVGQLRKELALGGRLFFRLKGFLFFTGTLFRPEGTDGSAQKAVERQAARVSSTGLV